MDRPSRWRQGRGQEAPRQQDLSGARRRPRQLRARTRMSSDQDHSVASRTVSTNGYRIHVRDEGEGRPLLLINGLTRPLSSWSPFVQAMTGGRFISFDAPGVGESQDSLLPLSIAELARMCVGVLDALGLDRVDVLGYSLGGAVAQELAARYPSRVARLVLAATSCGVGSTLAGW